jgi:hypothetical protein
MQVGIVCRQNLVHFSVQFFFHLILDQDGLTALALEKQTVVANLLVVQGPAGVQQEEA